jgi:hypothetical protein
VRPEDGQLGDACTCRMRAPCKRAARAADLHTAMTAGRGGGRPGRHASGDDTRLVTVGRPVLATVVAAGTSGGVVTHQGRNRENPMMGSFQPTWTAAAPIGPAWPASGMN